MADKEEIRSRSDILDVVQNVGMVLLKRRGRNYVGLCPFHSEKTGSFNVDPQTQTYKCFGCSEGGDVYKFVQKHQNMTFVEAAEYLARRAGLSFDRGPADAAKASEREQLFEVNRVAADWFQKALDRAADAREYLQRRGLAYETIRRFQIGFAPDDWEGLTNYLRSQRRDLRVAEKAGLIKARGDGSYFDMFRTRTIFPILDEQERIVGFGGRAMGDDQPKYLNTSDTPLFHKSKLLYGLPYARRKIASEGKVLLMEGYMDVIAAHQAGFENAVAAMGTSLTEDHAQKLARLMSENPVVVMVYDADKAGVKAALRGAPILEKEGVQAKVARLPAGEDPDSLLKSGAVDRFQKIIDGAIGRVEYLIEWTVANTDQTMDAGRAELLKRIVKILSTVQTRAERDIYIERVWRYHPLSAQGPAAAKMQLHQDAEAAASGGRRQGDQNGGNQPEAQERRPDDPSRQGQWQDRPKGGNGPWKKGYRGSREELRDHQRNIQPPPIDPGKLPLEEMAERRLVQALAEPQWRATVLKCIREVELVTEEGRRFYRFVSENTALLGDDPMELPRLLMAREEEAFSALILERLQESNALLANDPTTEAAIRESAEIARRGHQIRALQEEADRLMQCGRKLTLEEHERFNEINRTITQLKSRHAG